jgi:hypothetical protein
VLYAPSLRQLAPDATLVMATLPILDWNAALLADLAAVDVGPAPRVCAAVLATDPFACWEDIADALRGAGVSGVSNFPSLALVDRSALADLDAANLGYARELDRLAWFAGDGFHVLGIAATPDQVVEARNRLGSSLDALCLTEAGDLHRSLNTGLALVRAFECAAGEDPAPGAPILRIAEENAPTKKSKTTRVSTRTPTARAEPQVDRAPRRRSSVNRGS